MLCSILLGTFEEQHPPALAGHKNRGSSKSRGDRQESRSDQLVQLLIYSASVWVFFFSILKIPAAEVEEEVMLMVHVEGKIPTRGFYNKIIFSSDDN